MTTKAREFWIRQIEMDTFIHVREVLPSEESELVELRNFVKEIAESISGIRIAVDYLATREPSKLIHKTNIDYFKNLDNKLSELDIKIFSMGCFKGGKYIFNSAMEKK